MKKYDKSEQKLLALWAVDCTERVLPFFEKAYPNDDRLRTAIEVCRTWARTGIFKMAEIRSASLAAHAAARQANDDGNQVACLAARAAGQTVATAHVAQHAFGGALYALKAIAAADPVRAKTEVAKEHDWQAQQIATSLRPEFLKRVIVQERKRGTFVTIQKDEDF